MALSRHSGGTYQETSSHATCQGTYGHSRLSSLSHCGLILTKRVKLVCASLKKKKKKAQVSKNSRERGKSHHSSTCEVMSCGFALVAVVSPL